MNINPIVIFKMPLSLFPCYNQFKYLNTQLQPATPEGKTRKDGGHFISNLSFKPPSGAYFPVLHPATTENVPYSLTSYINITK